MNALRLRAGPGPRLGLALALLLSAPAGGSPQPATRALPFAVGEVLSYRAVSGRFGTFGTGTLRVEGPEELRGYRTYRLSFDFRGRVGPFRVEDQARSWLAPDEMMSLRYEARERSPLGTRAEAVELFPSEGRWSSEGRAGGETASATPLDELSFLYHVRCLPLADGESYDLTRHFDPSRNPVAIRVLRRERTRVPAGEYATVVVEMRVKDSRLGGSGTLVLYLTDDEYRVPVRIESSAPWVWPTRLVLDRATGVSLPTE